MTSSLVGSEMCIRDRGSRCVTPMNKAQEQTFTGVEAPSWNDAPFRSTLRRRQRPGASEGQAP
eukprot:10427990-Prorocentrum_lima.AAC.1